MKDNEEIKEILNNYFSSIENADEFKCPFGDGFHSFNVTQSEKTRLDLMNLFEDE